MRLTCPLCGERDRREFFYYGAEDYLDRPAEGAPLAAWDNYLHLRDNPAGETRDLWYHEGGCAQWLIVTRNTVTHAIAAVELVATRAPVTKPTPKAESRPEAKPAPRAAAKPKTAPSVATKVDAKPAATTAKPAAKPAAKTATKAPAARAKKTGPKP